VAITSPPLPPCTRTVVAVLVWYSAAPPRMTVAAAWPNSLYSFMSVAYSGSVQSTSFE
jgi:hypothetical protein